MAGSFLMSGCTHYFYLPNSHNVPLLHEKNDARLSLGSYTGTDGSTSASGFEFQGSYAVTNKVGIMASYMHASGSSGEEYGRGAYADVGAGYFTAGKSKHFVFETFGVIGYGGAENRFSNFATCKVNFTKVFVQPTLGYKSKNFDAAFSWRLASLHYASFGFNGQLTEADMNGIRTLETNPDFILSEPGITLRFGFEDLKIQVQTGTSGSLSVPTQSRLYYSIGAFFTLNGAVTKK